MTRGYQLLSALIIYFPCECYSIFFLFILDFIVLSAFEDWLVILQILLLFNSWDQDSIKILNATFQNVQVGIVKLTAHWVLDVRCVNVVQNRKLLSCKLYIRHHVIQTTTI